MINLKPYLNVRGATAAILVCAAFQVVAGTREMNSAALKVRVDTAFLRVVDYQWKASGATLYGQAEALREVGWTLRKSIWRKNRARKQASQERPA